MVIKNSKKQKIGIIGSGIGALACAARLAIQGHSIEIFESNASYGGKISEISLCNSLYRFDFGPSLLTKPEYIEDIFKLADKDPKDYFSYSKLESTCKYFWEDGTEFIAYANKTDLQNELLEKFPLGADSVIKFLQDIHKLYKTTSKFFIDSRLDIRSIFKQLKKIKLNDLFHTLQHLELHTNLFTSLKQTFKNEPKLIQLFSRYATYNGSSPYEAPAVLKVIPDLEFNQGAFLPNNGIRSIASSLYRLCLEYNVKFNFNSHISKVHYQDNFIRGLEINSGDLVKKDIYISNCDISKLFNTATYGQSNNNKIKNFTAKLNKQAKSSSGIVFYWAMKKEFSNLNLHNIFFSNNYKQEFEEIFNSPKGIPEDPTIYINITSKHIKKDAPQGHENWFVMTNCKTAAGEDWQDILTLRKNVIAKLNRILKMDIEKYIVAENLTDPLKLETRTGADKGCLYGSRYTSVFSSFERAQNYAPQIFTNLYHVGGTVHPGGGIPLCLKSAEIVANLIDEVTI